MDLKREYVGKVLCSRFPSKNTNFAQVVVGRGNAARLMPSLIRGSKAERKARRFVLFLN